MHYACEDGIEESVPHDYRLSSLCKPTTPIGHAMDGFFYPTLTLLIYSYTVYFRWISLVLNLEMLYRD